MPTERAFLELVAKAGQYFDSNCVYALMRLRQKIESPMKQS